MLYVRRRESFLDIYDNDKCVLSGIRPMLTDADGKMPELFAQSAEESDSRMEVNYSDGRNIRCTLTFLIDGARLCCRMSGDVLSEKGVCVQIQGLNKVRKLLGFYRMNRWWTRKIHVDAPEQLPDDIQTLFWRYRRSYFELFVLADNGLVSLVQPDAQGMRIQVRGILPGETAFDAALFTLTADEDPFALGKMTVEAVNRWLPDHCRCAEERRFPEILEYLGWCSWNAFYENVSEQGVLEKAREFREKGVPVQWMLLDNGWFRQSDSKLMSYEEDREKFPSGLKALKKNLNESGVRWMGVWHAMTGAWGNVAPESEIARDHPEALYTTRSKGMVPGPDRLSAFEFWDGWHSYLENQGVDFVKVDIQSSVPDMGEGEIPPQRMAREAHMGLEASVGIHFNGNCINCMGMSTESILSRPVSGVSRNSDDFFPKAENSFTSHILDNAYNALYHSAFFRGDWDMWWTIHPEAENHAYLRALSGGPIYISDPVGMTDAKMLKPLILSDGRILRCPQSGCVTADEILMDPSDVHGAFRVWNRYGGTLYLGIFALQGRSFRQKGEVAPADVPGCDRTKDYLLYRSGTDTAYFINWASRIATDMHAGLCALYSMTPEVGGVAFVGLLDKYLSAATIKQAVTGKFGASYVVAESGRIGYGCRRAHETYVNGRRVEPKHASDLWTIDLPESPESVTVEIRFVDEAK